MVRAPSPSVHGRSVRRDLGSGFNPVLVRAPSPSEPIEVIRAGANVFQSRLGPGTVSERPVSQVLCLQEDKRHVCLTPRKPPAARKHFLSIGLHFRRNSIPYRTLRRCLTPWHFSHRWAIGTTAQTSELAAHTLPRALIKQPSWLILYHAVSHSAST